MSSVIIKHAAIYHPKNSIGNDYFVEQMKDVRDDLGGFLEALGRKKRYLCASETSLSMGVKAASKALDEADLVGEDLDMIVFSSATPEFLSPPTSAIIHSELKGGNKCIVYDINVNCVGMVIALDQVCRYMKSNQNVNRALVIGAEQLFRFAKKDDAITYPNFGDASCAIILEKIPIEGVGFIDSEHYIDSSLAYEIKNPTCGLSKILDASGDEKKLYWSPFDTDQAFESAKESIERLLETHGYSKKDIGKYFISQFSVKNIRDISNQLEEGGEKFKYIGDEFGYTGTSSPFIAFTKAIQNDEMKENDLAVFWSVGAGVTACTVLYKHIKYESMGQVLDLERYLA